MNGIEQARHFTAEALRALRPGGVFFVVVPDYLKERTFFWDVDYTHNFVTTERRVRQLFNDGGFEVLEVERGIGLATGVARDALAAAALLVNIPGTDALSRYTGTDRAALQDPQEPVRDADLRRPQAWRGATADHAGSPVAADAGAAGRLVVDAARGHCGDPGLARHPHRHGRGGARGRLRVAAAPGGGARAGRGRSRRDDLALDPAAARPRRAGQPPRRRCACSWSARSSAASCPPASAATRRGPGRCAQITSRAGEALASVMVDRLLGVLSLAAMGVAGVLAWTPAGAGIGRVLARRRRAVGGLCRRVLGRCG